jgi:hypothetical protein
MVPVMDSLQRLFGDPLVVLPVAYEQAAVVGPVLAELQRQRPFSLPGVSGDQALNKLFPHRSLPHYVWIGPDGSVAAITGDEEVTAGHIRALLSRRHASLTEKKDLVAPYDGSRPLLLDGNGGPAAALRYHALLTGYLPGLIPGTNVAIPDSAGGARITLRNVPLVWLYRLAYSDSGRWFTRARIRLLTADSLKFATRLSGRLFEQWLGQGNGWCYELIVPGALAGQAYRLMQQDVARLFPAYSAEVEPVTARCLALVRSPGTHKLRTAGGAPREEIDPFRCELRNTSLAQLLKRLEIQYMQDSPLPIVDATGYRGRVDLSLHAALSSLADLNRALAPYGLQFIEKEALTPMLVIRDTAFTKP